MPNYCPACMHYGRSVILDKISGLPKGAEVYCQHPDILRQTGQRLVTIPSYDCPFGVKQEDCFMWEEAEQWEEVYE